MQSCLWFARVIPFPLVAGDRIYTGRLVQALAENDTAVTYVGLAGLAPPSPMTNVTWHVVPGAPRRQLASLFSIMPLVGKQYATAAYREVADQLLVSRRWDCVVIDHYGMGWLLDRMRALRADAGPLVFIGHDHEESVTRAQWLEAGRMTPKGLYFFQNYLKTRRIERRTARAADVITAITDADETVFQGLAPKARVVALTPGYNGTRKADREITAATPRAAVMLGGYRWSAKQANLKSFLGHAHAKLNQAGVELRVIGDMDDKLRQMLQAQYSSALFTGFVQDPAPLLDARIAVIAEPIGGGFKLKLLDYIFNRLPIVTLETCAAGLPRAVREHVCTVPDLDRLTDAVTSLIDDVPTLNTMQRGAFAAAEHAFDWADRGRALKTTILAAKPSGQRTSRKPLWMTGATDTVPG